MKNWVIIVAGGSGTRFGAKMPKQFCELGIEPVLMHTLRAFSYTLAGVDYEIVLVLPKEHVALWQELCVRYGFLVEHRVVTGGESRWHSVKNAIDTIMPATGDVIAVHDGVRPNVSAELITNTIRAAKAHGSAVPATPVTDTVRQLTDDSGSSVTLDRSTLRAVQTPQAFDATMLKAAYNSGYDARFTDDASVWEAAGHKTHLIAGDPANIKITHSIDLVIAEKLMHNE